MLKLTVKYFQVITVILKREIFVKSLCHKTAINIVFKMIMIMLIMVMIIMIMIRPYDNETNHLFYHDVRNLIF